MSTNRKNKKLAKPKRKKLVLIGYIEKSNEDNYFGICLTLNLHAYGKSYKEVRQKLNKLLIWYIKDAIKNKDFKRMIPRRAPIILYMKYCLYTYSNKSIIKYLCILIMFLHHHIISSVENSISSYKLYHKEINPPAYA